MAWLFKRNKTWWLGFRVRGKLIRRSTGCSDKTKAQEILKSIELMEQARKAGALTEEYFSLVTGRKEKRIAAAEFLQSWLDSREPDLAAGTFRKYRLFISEFISHIEGSGIQNLSEITARTVSSYLTDKRKDLGPAAVRNRHRTLVAAFNSAVAEGFIDSSPMKAVKPPSIKRETKVRRPFTLDELEKLLLAADPFWSCLIRLAVFTGLRLGDCIQLDSKNIDLDGGIIHLRIEKTSRTISIPIAESLHDELKKWVKAKGPLFPLESQKYKDQGSGAFSPVFSSLIVKAGFRGKPSPDRRDGKGRSRRRVSQELTVHSLRHSFVSLLKSAGATDSIARELAGHSSLAVNQEYTHLPIEILKRSIDRIPKI